MAFVLTVLCLLPFLTSAKVYKRCDLAKELRDIHDIPASQVATWVCIAQHESNLNTAATNRGSGDHGIFQISEHYWCSATEDDFKACGVSCSSLRDDDIEDDVVCAKRIYRQFQRRTGDGFKAWAVYNYYCTDPVKVSRYIDGCFRNRSLVVDAPNEGTATIVSNHSNFRKPKPKLSWSWSFKVTKTIYYDDEKTELQIPSTPLPCTTSQKPSLPVPVTFYYEHHYHHHHEYQHHHEHYHHHYHKNYSTIAKPTVAVNTSQSYLESTVSSQSVSSTQGYPESISSQSVSSQNIPSTQGYLESTSSQNIQSTQEYLESTSSQNILSTQEYLESTSSQSVSSTQGYLESTSSQSPLSTIIAHYSTVITESGDITTTTENSGKSTATIQQSTVSSQHPFTCITHPHLTSTTTTTYRPSTVYVFTCICNITGITHLHYPQSLTTSYPQASVDYSTLSITGKPHLHHHHRRSSTTFISKPTATPEEKPHHHHHHRHSTATFSSTSKPTSIHNNQFEHTTRKPNKRPIIQNLINKIPFLGFLKFPSKGGRRFSNKFYRSVLPTERNDFVPDKIVKNEDVNQKVRKKYHGSYSGTVFSEVEEDGHRLSLRSNEFKFSSV